MAPTLVVSIVVGLLIHELSASNSRGSDQWLGPLPGTVLSMCCPLMWHLPRFVWLIRHALSRDPSLSFAFQSL